MKSKWLSLSVGALLVAAGCSGSSDDATSDSFVESDVATTEAVDLAEGAFTRNEGTASAGDGSEPAVDVAETAAPAAEAIETTSSDSDAASTTSAPDSSTDGGTTGDGATSGTTDTTTTGGSTSGGATTDGTTGTATDGGTATTTTVADTATTTTTPTTSGPGVGEGLVEVAGISYPFRIDSCEFGDGSMVILGFGTSSDNIMVDVEIVADAIDLDGDDELDELLELSVLASESNGGDLDLLPDLLASKIDSGAVTLGADIEFVIDGPNISGSGPMDDFNGVVIADGETAEMTFEARCAPESA